MRQLSSETILEKLKIHRKEMETRFSLRSIALFGSHLHGNATSSSDIDFVVEFENISFDHYMDLKTYLEKIFNKPVDLVLSDSIKPRIKSLIMQEAVHV